MRKKPPFVSVVILITILTAPVSSVEDRTGGTTAGSDNEGIPSFTGQDLHLAGGKLISYQLSADSNMVHILVFQDGFSMLFGDNQYLSDKAVVWLQSLETIKPRGPGVDYKVWVYLHGNISAKKSQIAETADLSRKVLEEGKKIVLHFCFRGEVVATAQTRETTDPHGLEIYAEAFSAVGSELPLGIPALAGTGLPLRKQEYPINLSPAGEAAFVTEWDDQTKIGTVIGRFYIWQKQDESGRLLELQADNAVIFCSKQMPESVEKGRLEDILVAGAVQAIYLCGDVVMTEGLRSIQADEIYYDFQQKKALAINAVARTFDVSRGIPIYIRATKLRQLAENKFTAENVTLTTSEFYLPQISLNATQISITDSTNIDQQADRVSDSSFDAQMRDVRFKMYDKTIFYWPIVRSNLQRPDVPLKSVHIGNDNTWGTSVETQWFLSRLLGLQQPQGTDSTFFLDYYSKRGLGSGLEINYTKEDHFGRILGYIIDDHGEDRLGRLNSRKDIEPPRELRGRIRWQHKQFLPYNWQLATEVSYASDKNFIEQFYRSEFNTDKEQETVVHLKRIERNFGLSFLGKARLNDFQNTVEEFPSAEFHWTGQSFFDDRLTFYSDSQFSRFRQSLDTTAPAGGTTVLQRFFTYTATRNEIDLPLTVGRSKVVPFAAGTLGYEDGLGFHTELDGSMTEEDAGVWLGEAGVRASTMPFWKVYPDVNSRLWDLNGLRHVIQPKLTAVAYTESDSVVKQRDTLNLGLSQRLQTRRGEGSKERTIDWMRLDTEVVWVRDSGDTSAGPDRFIWNKPFIPLVNRFSRRFGESLLPPQDRRNSDIFGPRRNYLSTDYIWRISDTTAILSDMNFDLQSGVVQQFNIGISALRWPNLSYYIGSRYLRRLDNGYGQEGSNAFTFAATYALDPRYTLSFSQQYDFDYGVNIRNDITLIRRYHRVYFALTYSVDESLDQHAVVFSIWPQGVPELAIGPRRYTKLGISENY